MDLNGWILHRFVNSAGWSFEHIDWTSKWHEMLRPYPIANQDTIKHNRNPSQNLRKRTRALLSPCISQTLPSLLLPSALGLCRQSLCCTLSLEFGCNVHLNQRTSNNHQSVDWQLGLKGVALAVSKIDMKASISATRVLGFTFGSFLVLLIKSLVDKIIMMGPLGPLPALVTFSEQVSPHPVPSLFPQPWHCFPRVYHIPNSIRAKDDEMLVLLLSFVSRTFRTIPVWKMTQTNHSMH